MSKIAFVVQLPKGRSPSQRFRCEAWEPDLIAAGHEVETFPFFDGPAAAILYKPGNFARKILAVIRGFIGRISLTFKIKRYDFIFVQREASPVGPPVFEWLWSRVFARKLIYDYDDAIWIPNTSSQNRLANGFKAFWKIGKICRWAHAVAAGNDFLCDFARRHTPARRVVKIPTVVDTVHRYNQLKQHDLQSVSVGWTGSHSTLKYLDEIVPLIRNLQQEINFKFIVIADKKPALPLENWEFVPWDPRTEIEDLLKIDIGIMPLTADPWSEGKCGFKLIQYLALGIPAVASPVGVNREIIADGTNGYLAQDTSMWESRLRTLIRDASKRNVMGAAGRAKIESEYSLDALRERFLGLFNVDDIPNSNPESKIESLSKP